MKWLVLVSVRKDEISTCTCTYVAGLAKDPLQDGSDLQRISAITSASGERSASLRAPQSQPPVTPGPWAFSRSTKDAHSARCRRWPVL